MACKCPVFISQGHSNKLLKFYMQAVIRSVCAIIDAFHFPTVAEAALTSAEGGADVSADAAEIQTALIKRVLPALQTHLVGQLYQSVISTCLRDMLLFSSC